MAIEAKSVIEIEVHDQAFVAFKKMFDEFKTELDKLPNAWAKIGAVQFTSQIKSANEAIAMHNKVIKTIEEQDTRQRKRKETQDKTFQEKRRKSEEDALRRSEDEERKSLERRKRTFMSFATKGIFAFEGVRAAGDLLGKAYNFAASSAELMKTSMGLQVAPSELKAVQDIFGKYLSAPESILGALQKARIDKASEAYQALLALGISPADVERKTSMQLLPEVLTRIKTQIGTTPQEQAIAGTRLAAMKVPALGITQEDITRLIQLQQKDIDELGKHAQAQADNTRITKEAGKAMIDFTTAIDKLGSTAKLSAIEMTAPTATALAGLGTEPLKRQIKDVATKATAAELIAASYFMLWNRLFGKSSSTPTATTPATTLATPDNFSEDKIVGLVKGRAPVTNPGGIMSGNLFRNYSSLGAGLRAMKDNLLDYHKKHRDTIESIVSNWAPAAARNDVEAYIRDVTARSGISRSQTIDFNDRDMMSRLISAMTQHENINPQKPAEVKIMVYPQSGGSPQVAVSQQGAGVVGVGGQ